jgi:hypothetical protein
LEEEYSSSHSLAKPLRLTYSLHDGAHPFLVGDFLIHVGEEVPIKVTELLIFIKGLVADADHSLSCENRRLLLSGERR